LLLKTACFNCAPVAAVLRHDCQLPYARLPTCTALQLALAKLAKTENAASKRVPADNLAQEDFLQASAIVDYYRLAPPRFI